MTSNYYYKGNALSNIISGTKPGFQYTIYANTQSSFVSNYYLAGNDKITSYYPVSKLDKPTTLGFREGGVDLQNKTAVFTYAYAEPLKTNANSNQTTGSNTGQYASIQQFGGGTDYNITIPSYINNIAILLWGAGGGGGAGGNNGASGGGGGGSGGWVFYPDYQVRTNSTNSIELTAGVGGAGGRNTGQQQISGQQGGQSYFVDNTNGYYIAATGGGGALNGNGGGSAVAGGGGGWYDFVGIPPGGQYGLGAQGGTSGSGQAGYGGHGGQYPFSNDFNNTISSVNQAGTFFNSNKAQSVNGATAGNNAPGYGLGGGGGGGNGANGTTPLYGGAGGAGYAQVWLYF